jgi:hypothetical protein
MSLYNMLFGVNELAGLWLGMLELSTKEVGRFRDCYLIFDFENPKFESSKICVYTRNGGLGEEDCSEVFERVSAHECFLGVKVDKTDETYCTYEFN